MAMTSDGFDPTSDEATIDLRTLAVGDEPFDAGFELLALGAAREIADVADHVIESLIDIAPRGLLLEVPEGAHYEVSEAGELFRNGMQICGSRLRHPSVQNTAEEAMLYSDYLEFLAEVPAIAAAFRERR